MITCNSPSRLKLICTALACIFALMTTSLAAADAHAAPGVQAAPAGTPSTQHSLDRKYVPRSSRAIWNDTAVSFRNSYGKTLWVAFSRTDDVCGWKKTGWYRIAPGERLAAFSTTSRYAYYYAMAEDGAEWAGNYPSALFKDRAFDECDYDVAWSHPNAVGMREIDTSGTLHMEIDLIP